MRLRLFVLSVIFGASCVADARAQVIAPGLDNNLNVNFDQAFASITNPFLSDSIKLNYQITLLEKMTQRQAELGKISEAFSALGIPYHEPAPSYTLCGQLPPNVPCLRHYPQLYQSLVTERRQHYAEMEMERALQTGVVTEQAAAIDPSLLERAKKEREEAAKREEQARLEREAVERQNRYRWSEISCLDGKCTGVITGGDQFRATVHAGSRLADGSLIKSVNRSGIQIVIDGDVIDLRPQPVDGSAPTQVSTSPLRQSIQDDRVVRVVNTSSSVETISNAPPAINAAAGAGEMAPAPRQMSAADMAGGGVVTPSGASMANEGGASSGTGAPGGVTMVEPTLGPSGLF